MVFLCFPNYLFTILRSLPPSAAAPSSEFWGEWQAARVPLFDLAADDLQPQINVFSCSMLVMIGHAMLASMYTNVYECHPNKKCKVNKNTLQFSKWQWKTPTFERNINHKRWAIALSKHLLIYQKKGKNTCIYIYIDFNQLESTYPQTSPKKTVTYLPSLAGWNNCLSSPGILLPCSGKSQALNAALKVTWSPFSPWVSPFGIARTMGGKPHFMDSYGTNSVWAGNW